MSLQIKIEQATELNQVFKTEFWDQGRLCINVQYAEWLKQKGIYTADDLWKIVSTPVKKVVKERGTEKAEWQNPEGKSVSVFIKRYYPNPLKEKVKNWICGKFHCFDAINEWLGICGIKKAGLSTMVPLAVAQFADGRSCNLTLGINHYQRASEYLVDLIQRDPERAQRLICKLAEFAARMHSAGMAHQDFYLVHFFVVNAPEQTFEDNLHLIDLQRTIRQNPLANRWIIKDMGQLFFSIQRTVPNHPELLQWLWNDYLSFSETIEQKEQREKLLNAVKSKAKSLSHREDRLLRRKKKIK